MDADCEKDEIRSVNYSRVGSLPPHVEGDIYGQLAMNIKKIEWRDKEYDLCYVRVSWWGENGKGVVIPVRTSENKGNITSSKSTFIYNIMTNFELFLSYLEDCEELSFDIFEEHNNIFIGSATLKYLTSIMIYNPYEISCVVSNSHGKAIGDLTVLFKNQCSKNKYEFEEEVSEKQEIKLQQSQGRHPISPLEFSSWKRRLLKEKTGLKGFRSHDDSGDVTDSDISELLEECHQIRRRYEKVDSILKPLNANMSGYESETFDNLPGRNCEKRNESSAVYTSIKCMLPQQSILERNNNHRDNKINKHDRMNKNDVKNRKLRKALRHVYRFDEKKMPSNLDENLHCIDVFPSRVHRRYDEEKSREMLQDFSQRAKVLVLTIETLSFNYVGMQKALLSFQNTISKTKIQNGSESSRYPHGVVYFIEYEIPSHISSSHDSRGRPWNSDLIRFCSRKLVEKCVHFHRETVHMLAHNKTNFSELLYNSSIKFKIYSRYLNQRIPSLIGVTNLPLAKIMDSRSLKTVNELPIFTHCNIPGQVSLGILRVITDLRSQRPVDVRPEKSVTCCGEERLSEGEDYEITSMVTKTVGSSKSKGICNDHYPSVKPHSKTKETVVSKTPCSRNLKLNCKTSNLACDTKEKSTLLYGLLHVSHGRNFKCTSSYLVSHGFWKDDVMMSDVCFLSKNYNFKLHKVMPVLLTMDFLDRCHNNFLIVEVWSQSNLMGISKLPLNQFYIAYRDSAVVEQLMLSKYPIFGIDGWVCATDPVSLEEVGELHVILALGTESQIQMLEMSRCLKEFVQPHPVSHSPSADGDDIISESVNLLNKSEDLESPFPGNTEKITETTKTEVNSYINEISSYSIVYENRESEEIRHDVETENGYSDLISLKSIKENQEKDGKFHGEDLSCDNSVHCSNKLYSSSHSPDKQREHLNSSFISSPSIANPSQYSHQVLQDSLEANVNLQHSDDSLGLGLDNFYNNHCSEHKDIKNSKNEGNALDKRASDLTDISIVCRNPTKLQRQENALKSAKSAIINKDLHNPIECFSSVGNGCDHYFSEEKFERNKEDYSSQSEFLPNANILELEDKNLMADRLKCSSVVSIYDSGDAFCDISLNSPQNLTQSSSQLASKILISGDASTQTEKSCSEKFSVIIDVISAMNLPRVNFDKFPNCYVTIHVAHDLILTTPVIYETVEPVWNWSSEMMVPCELFDNNSKCLILKVWHKETFRNKQCATVKDFVLGFVALDLRILLYDFPCICGWFNLTDFSGCCKGQIQVSLTPVENFNLVQNKILTTETNRKEPNTERNINTKLNSKFVGDSPGNKSADPIINNMKIDSTPDSSSLPFLSTKLREKLSELDGIIEKMKKRSERNQGKEGENYCCNKTQQCFNIKGNPSVSSPCSSVVKNSHLSVPEEMRIEAKDIAESDLSAQNTEDKQNEKLLTNIFSFPTCSHTTSCHFQSSSTKEVPKMSDIQLCTVEASDGDKIKNEVHAPKRDSSSNLLSHSNNLMHEALGALDLESIFNPLLFQHIIASHQFNNITSQKFAFNNCMPVSKSESFCESSNQSKSSHTKGDECLKGTDKVNESNMNKYCDTHPLKKDHQNVVENSLTKNSHSTFIIKNDNKNRDSYCEERNGEICPSSSNKEEFLNPSIHSNSQSMNTDIIVLDENICSCQKQHDSATKDTLSKAKKDQEISTFSQKNVLFHSEENHETRDKTVTKSTIPPHTFKERVKEAETKSSDSSLASRNTSDASFSSSSDVFTNKTKFLNETIEKDGEDQKPHKCLHKNEV